MEDIILDIDLGKSSNVITKRDDIALIDADTILFGSCVTVQTENELLPIDMYLDEEWENILNDPGYIPELNIIRGIDLDEAYSHALSKINTILDETGCSGYELHFTKGRSNFRYDIFPEYKANRTKDKTKLSPYRLIDLKMMFVNNPEVDAYIHSDFEADDIVVMKKKEYPDKYLLVAVDKDVLGALAGTHFNYYSSPTYDIAMKFVTTDKEDAMKWSYKQTLMGDAGDGIIGLKGIGKVKADKLLADCDNEQECWQVVIDAYEDIAILKNGLDANIIDAITNMRLVNMHQLNINEEIVLWKPF